MQALWDARGALLEGLGLTVLLTLLSSALALVLALLAGAAMLSRVAAARAVAKVYVEFFRGTSLLAQLFWLFFVLPMLGLDLSPMVCGVAGLGLCFGAYGAEIVRGSLESIPRGQHDALAALNFSPTVGLRVVLLPQAIVLMLPLFANLAIELLKATSLVSLITIPELTFVAKSLILGTYDTARILLFILLAYFLLSIVISRSLRKLETHMSYWRAPTNSREATTHLH